MTLTIGSFYFFLIPHFMRIVKYGFFMKTETGEKYILLNMEKYT